LVKAGVEVPADMNLELAKYVNKRGVKPLNFKPEFEFKDPFGIQELVTPETSMGLKAVASSEK
jgi:nitrite reductase (cytochrome c-552)